MAQLKIDTDFLKKTAAEQKEFLNDLGPVQDISKDNLKVYIQMKTLVLARCAMEEKSGFNLTAQFRNFLQNFWDKSDLSYKTTCANTDYNQDGFKFTYLSHMGVFFNNEKKFKVQVGDDCVLSTKIKRESRRFRSRVNKELITTWNEADRTQLKLLFDEIKKQARYENTLGYDLLCTTTILTLGLFVLSIFQVPTGLQLITVPLAILLNVPILLVAIPTTFILSVLEYLVVEPVKFIVNALRTDDFDQFLNELDENRVFETLGQMP